MKDTSCGMAEPIENQICSDCLKRFSCIFNAFIPKKVCGLYESDTEFVKETINRLNRYLESKQKDNPIRNAKEILKARKSGWINIKDRRPVNQKPVLVYVPPYSDDDEEYTGYVGVSYYTYSVRGGFWAGTDGNVYGAIGIIHEPSHWMPLPEPPKEDE